MKKFLQTTILLLSIASTPANLFAQCNLIGIDSTSLPSPVTYHGNMSNFLHVLTFEATSSITINTLNLLASTRHTNNSDVSLCIFEATGTNTGNFLGQTSFITIPGLGVPNQFLVKGTIPTITLTPGFYFIGYYSSQAVYTPTINIAPEIVYQTNQHSTDLVIVNPTFSANNSNGFCIWATFTEQTTDTKIECAPYTWIDGNVYTANNNTATVAYTNVAGCDSVVTLNLTIADNASTNTRTECAPFTWIDGNVYTTDNNTATFTLQNTAGCDSVVTLDLTIANNASTDARTECAPFTWIDGNVYSTDNNTATFTLQNAAGCDSVVTLNLTIKAIDISTSFNGNTITANNSNASYQWINCDGNTILANETNISFAASENGDYAVIISENGCQVDTSACVTLTGIGVAENSLNHQISVFPNPTIGDFTINLNNVIETFTLKITNTNGQVISTKEYSATSSLAISLNEPAGVYFLHLITKDRSSVIKVVKQ